LRVLRHNVLTMVVKRRTREVDELEATFGLNPYRRSRPYLMIRANAAG
jgi:hypothetical protein